MNYTTVDFMLMNYPIANIVHSLIEACIYDCGHYGCDFPVDNCKVKFLTKLIEC